MNFGTIDTTKIDLRRTYFFSDIERTFKISRSTLELWRARGILKVHDYQRSATRGEWLINAIRLDFSLVLALITQESSGAEINRDRDNAQAKRYRMALTQWYECKNCKCFFTGNSEEDECPECHSGRIKYEGSDD